MADKPFPSPAGRPEPSTEAGREIFARPNQRVGRHWPPNGHFAVNEWDVIRLENEARATKGNRDSLLVALQDFMRSSGRRDRDVQAAAYVFWRTLTEPGEAIGG